MNDRKIKERRQYLALQAFYLTIKKSVEELESKLNLNLKKSNSKNAK